jgi:competence protein ComEA
VEPSGAPWRVLETTEQEAPARPEARGVPWLVVGGVLLAAALGAGGLLFATRSDPVIEVDGGGQADPSAASDRFAAGRASPSAVGVLVVEVGGAVVRPGVYRLTAGSRVADAIGAAGGFSARVDAELADRELNLASSLRDGDEIHVPVRGDPGEVGGPAGGAAGGGGGGTSQGPIDLNTATPEQLDTLPGVGPVTVAKIVAARQEQPFSNVDDLGTRKVLGAATLDKIRALVTVSP